MTTPLPSTRLRPFEPLPFGRFLLLSPLATGGMAELFLARMQAPGGFDKLCVIKKILPPFAGQKDFVGRFMDEARTLAQLSHGTIAQVLEMGVQKGEPFLALEYVDGKDLSKVIERQRELGRPMPVGLALALFSKVLDALGYLHRKRGEHDEPLHLVHRDISPQNLLVSYEGELKLIDFGLAKSALHLTRTHPRVMLGKLLYMSPEQARHEAVDHRSDLYSMALCLYEALCGEHPNAHVSASELMARMAAPQLPPVTRWLPSCPPSVAALLARALAPAPKARFQTAAELQRALQQCLMEEDPSAGPEALSSFMRRTFAQEYQAERRQLSVLTAAWEPVALTEETAPGLEDTVVVSFPQTPRLSPLEDTSPFEVPQEPTLNVELRRSRLWEVLRRMALAFVAVAVGAGAVVGGYWLVQVLGERVPAPVTLPSTKPAPSAVEGLGTGFAEVTVEEDAPPPQKEVGDVTLLLPVKGAVKRGRHAAKVAAKALTPAHAASTLSLEWAKTRAAFLKLERSSPCDSPEMTDLCESFRQLSEQIEDDEHDPNDANLLEQARVLRRRMESP